MIKGRFLLIRVKANIILFGMNELSLRLIVITSFLFAFSVAASAQITSIEVTSPSQTDVWTYGQSFYIGWTVTGSGNVKIEYSINGGLNWFVIDTSVVSTNGANTYLWNIPDKPTTQALIRISETDGSPIDTSLAYFMIKSPQTSLSGKVKILPFGDSITFGNFDPSLHAGDLAGYRFKLWDSLRTNDYNFDFIGSEYSGYNYFPDYQNGGFGGILTLELKQMLIDGTNIKFVPVEVVTPGPYLDYHPANVILFHMGTTDVPNTDTTAFGAILDTIRSNDVNTWVVVAKILDLSPTGLYNVTEYNTKLERAARVRINSGYKILIVNMENIDGFDYAIGTGDMYDDTHPNASGYAKMANVWYQALKLILPVGSAAAPIFAQTVDTIAYVGVPFNYQAVASGVGVPSYSISSGSWTINSNTGKVSWTPGTTGTVNMTITASNGTNLATQDLTINVLAAPSLPAQLVSYWKFDENRVSGPYADTYNTNNGYAYIGPDTISLGSTTGQVGGAYSFDGTDKVSVLDNPDINFSTTTNSFTAEAWINVSGGSGNRVVVGKYGRSTRDSHWWLGVNSSGQATFEISQYNAGDRTTTTVTSAVIGAGWHHIVGVKNGNTDIKVYLDTVASTASLSLSTPFNTLRPFNIGHLYNSSLFTGLIDEVAIYNGALDQATITNHFNRGTNHESYFGQIELIVVSPVQDTILTSGESFFIKWTSTGTCNVKLEYSLNGGLNWREITSGVSTVAGLNQYPWTDIPDTPSTQVLIRINEVGGAASDTSTAYFMIKSPQTDLEDLSGTVKILPFGDTITFGYFDSPPPPQAGDLAGYEFYLWDSLRTNNYNFDFVGSEYSGYNYFPDYENGGFGGIKAEWLKQILVDGTNLKYNEVVTPGPFLNFYPAKVILLHVGTTIVDDIGIADSSTFGALLDEIRNLNPNIWVVVAKIIDLSPTGQYYVTEYNDRIENASRIRINAGYKILIVDMEKGAGIDYDIDATIPFGDTGDMYDNTYPNPSGYAKMANVWYQALKLILPAGTPTAPNFVQPNVDTVAFVEIPFNYQAIASGVGTPSYSISTGPWSINSKTGKVNWTPTATGTINMSITASNGTSDDIQNLTIQVLATSNLPTELVSYWRFDENRAAGPFTDEYNINNGYLGNADSLLTSVTGQVGGAYTFDGKDKINVLDNTNLNFSSTTNSFTAEAWINITGGSGNRVVMGKFGRNLAASSSNDSYWWFGVNNSGHATFVVSQYDGSRITTQVTSSAAIGTGWHHIAGVKSGSSDIKVYVDGISNSNVTGLSAPIKSLRPLNIGHLANSNLFVGSIDEAAIYNGALSSSTILSHYNKGYLNHDGYFDQVVEITINHPEQNETLSYGQNFTIEWNSVGTGNVKLEYSLNGGLNWLVIDSSETSYAGLNQYLWSNIPNKPTTQGLIRIKNAYGDTTLDESTPYFLIKSPQFSGDSTVKILNLGNSITGGTNSDLPIIGNTGDRAGYEYRLWDSLRTNNYNFDFIGSEYSGYNFFPDYQNAGFPGATTSDLLSILQTGLNTKFEPSDRITDVAYLNYYPANITLILTGTNDLSVDTSTVCQLMDYIHDNYSASWMIIGKILKSDNSDSTVYKNYNTNLEAAVRKRINLGYKILIVDMYNISGFVYTAVGDLSDEIHPDSSGYAKMANVWYPALKLLLPDGTKAPSFISPSVTSGSVGRPYNYTAQAIPSPKIYSLSVNPTGMIINQNTGKISWTPDSVGSYPVTILAQNDIGSNSQSFTIDVTNLQTWPTNLISYWRFDESGDTSRNFLDSYELNSGFSETSLDSTSGRVHKAFSLDGSTNKINVLDQPEFDFVNSSFTVEAWIKPNSSTGDRTIIGKYGRTIDESYWWLGLNNTNQATFFTSFDSKTFSFRNDKQVTSPTSLTNGSWNHIVGVKDSINNIKIYVNGGSPVTLSLGTIVDTINSSRPLNIGHWYNKNLFNGSVDEVAIYNKALSQTEITDHYQRGNIHSKGYFDNFVLVKSKIFLQGPYDSLSNSMITVLDTTGLIPLTSPYSQDPRTVDSIPSDIVDWVLVELRSSLIGGDTIGYKSAFLKNDGTIVGDDGINNNLIVDVPPGSYYIVIRHRNHVAVMSSDTLILNDNSSVPVTYDFTTGSAQFYGGSSGSKQIETGVWGMMAGDANGNGQVQNNDSENYWKPDNGTAGYKNSDFNLNGQVQNNDNENYWKPNNGRGSQVPNI